MFVKSIYFITIFSITLFSFPLVPLNSNLSPILSKCFNSIDGNLLYGRKKLCNTITPFGMRRSLNSIDGDLLYYRSNKFLVTATAYTPCKSECDDSPFITASGKTVRDNIIAVSRDLYKILPFGSEVKINNKIYIVDDLMNRRWKKRIDFFVWSKERARAFGKRKVVMEILTKAKI